MIETKSKTRAVTLNVKVAICQLEDPKFGSTSCSVSISMIYNYVYLKYYTACMHKDGKFECLFIATKEKFVLGVSNFNLIISVGAINFRVTSCFPQLFAGNIDPSIHQSETRENDNA